MGATLSIESVFAATVLVAAVAFGYHHYTFNLSNGNTGSKQQDRPEENKLGPLVSPVLSISGVRSTMPGQFHETPNHSLSSKSKKSKRKKKSQYSTTELNTTLQPPPNSPPAATRDSQPPQPSTIVDVSGSRTHADTCIEAEKKNGQNTEDITTTPDAGKIHPLDQEFVERVTVTKRPSPKAPKTNVDELSGLGACLYLILISIKACSQNSRRSLV